MDIDASAISNKLAQLDNLPTPVSSWLVETGIDSTDDPAVWVWAFLEQHGVEFAKRTRLRSLIREAVNELTGPAYWVYVYFPGAWERDQFT